MLTRCIHGHIAYFNIIIRYAKNKISCLFCCINICVLRAPRSNLIYTQVPATLTLFQICKHFLLIMQILIFFLTSVYYAILRFSCEVLCSIFTVPEQILGLCKYCTKPHKKIAVSQIIHW